MDSNINNFKLENDKKLINYLFILKIKKLNT